MSSQIEIPAVKVKQWLQIWDTVKFDNENRVDNRKKPQRYFLLFTVKAGLLKRLSKVYPRKADKTRDIEIGVQRKHDPERSKEISNYLHKGYPLSDIVKGKKIPSEYKDLQMPGWLPTAIVANVLSEGSQRGSKTVNKKDLIEIRESDSGVKLILPKGCASDTWNPEVPPIEIIDGQHRLWAFDPSDKISDEFELPVVAFYDLDITWQAYLFYTINVKPKKINRSLAYDLYPLLRVQEWLEKSPDTANVYKETRAQEIVEVLWSYKGSAWKDRINMLGDTSSHTNITQAAFIRNLVATFIKTKATRSLGGLFGAKLNDDHNLPLNWNRVQQVSTIIFLWNKLSKKVADTKLEWTNALRDDERQKSLLADSDAGDLAFISRYCLLTTDQGVRGILNIFNDFLYVMSSDLGIRDVSWKNTDEIKEDYISDEDVDVAIKDLEKSALKVITESLCDELVKFDWRTSSEPHLTPIQRQAQMVFKGSGGYKELRRQLLQLLSKSKNKTISTTAQFIFNDLNYAD